MEAWRRDRRIVGDMIRRVLLHIIGPLLGHPTRLPFRRPIVPDSTPAVPTPISIEYTDSSSSHSNKSSLIKLIQTPSTIPVETADPSHAAPSQATQKSPTNGSMYTDGPSRIVLAHDGFKNCHALLLTKDLVADLGRIIKESQSLEQVEYDLDLVQRKANVAQSSIDQLHYLIEISKSQQEIDRLANDIVEREPQLLEICQRRDYLEDENQTLKRNLNYIRAQAQDIFERALADARLLRFPEPEEAQKGIEVEPESRAPSVSSDVVTRSPEEVEREAIRANLERSRVELNRAQEAFDTRHQSCDKDRGEYHEAVRAGMCDLPGSEFDRLEVNTMREITRDLIDAEAVYDEILAQARAHDLISNQFDQESNFVDDYYDDYRESYDTPVAGPDNYFIEHWMKETDYFKDRIEAESETEVDEWDAKVIESWDSVSVVDHTRNRKRIDRWQQICGV